MHVCVSVCVCMYLWRVGSVYVDVCTLMYALFFHSDFLNSAAVTIDRQT